MCLCVARLYKVSHITVQKKSEEKECHSEKEKKRPKIHSWIIAITWSFFTKLNCYLRWWKIFHFNSEIKGYDGFYTDDFKTASNDVKYK